MNATKPNRRPRWTREPLYLFLMEIFPGDRHRSICSFLDVEELSRDLKRSPEAVYKWLRKSRLTPENAQALLALAHAPENIAALAKVERKPPEIRDFDRFVFSAA